MFGCKNVSNNSFRVIKFALFMKERNQSIPVLSSVSHVYLFVLFISIKRK